MQIFGVQVEVLARGEIVGKGGRYLLQCAAIEHRYPAALGPHDLPELYAGEVSREQLREDHLFVGVLRRHPVDGLQSLMGRLQIQIAVGRVIPGVIGEIQRGDARNERDLGRLRQHPHRRGDIQHRAADVDLVSSVLREPVVVVVHPR